MTDAEHLIRWEQAEIDRSMREASTTDLDRLRIARREINRYLDPPVDTYFPLEYSYHLLGNVQGKVVLDFGCGNGENTLLLASRGALVLSMDLSEALIGLARRRLQMNRISGDVTFLVASAHDIPLRDESVDVIFGIAILHHLDLGLAAPEVHRVLRKRGRAIFQEPIRNSKLLRSVRKLIPYRHPNVSPFERPLTDNELTNFGSHFTIVRERAFYLPTLRVVQHLPIVRERSQRLFRLDAQILKRFPSLNRYACIKVIEFMK